MLLILFALAGVCLLNLGYYFVFLKLGFYPSQPTFKSENRNLPVSVIICAKNEAENLKKFLPSILQQEYPDFEIILVNDASVDDTLEVMESFQASYRNIKIVNVQNNEAFWANKKYALTLGIKKAKYKHLLFTDADCEPQSAQWISAMAVGFSEKKDFVLGYGGYFREKNSFLNKIIRFETLLSAIQYFSFALWGNPYMGVGRNLAYTSTRFYQQNGFASHLHIRSGDDDLFVNESATAENTSICITPESFTRSLPKRSFSEWFLQKRRHISTAQHYRSQDKILLGLFYFSQLFFWILFIISAFGAFWKIALGILLFRLLLQGTVFHTTSEKFGEKDLFWIFPVAELFLISAQLGIFITNIFSKPPHWK